MKKHIIYMTIICILFLISIMLTVFLNIGEKYFILKHDVDMSDNNKKYLFLKKGTIVKTPSFLDFSDRLNNVKYKLIFYIDQEKYSYFKKLESKKNIIYRNYKE